LNESSFRGFSGPVRDRARVERYSILAQLRLYDHAGHKQDGNAPSAANPRGAQAAFEMRSSPTQPFGMVARLSTMKWVETCDPANRRENSKQIR